MSAVWRRVSRVAAFALFAASCNGSPTAPTPMGSAVVPVLFMITPSTTTLSVGQSHAHDARLVLSDGTSRVVDATWAVAPLGVLTVSSSGTVTAVAPGAATLTASGNGLTASAVAPGAATLTASGNGLTASAVVHVIVNYSGEWEGRARAVACVGEAAYCELRMRMEPRLQLWVDQVGASARGYLAVGYPIENGLFIDGTEQPDGVLILRGEKPSDDPLAPPSLFVLRVTDWRTTVDHTGTMTGTFWIGGTAERLQYQLSDVRRTRNARERATSERRPSRSGVDAVPSRADIRPRR